MKGKLTKTEFLCAPILSPPIFITYSHDTYVVFGPNLDPFKVSRHKNCRFFTSILYPPGPKYVLEL